MALVVENASDWLLLMKKEALLVLKKLRWVARKSLDVVLKKLFCVFQKSAEVVANASDWFAERNAAAEVVEK